MKFNRELLKRRRIEKGFDTADELAYQLRLRYNHRVSKQTVYAWEDGSINFPGMINLIALSRLLDVEITDFIID